MPPDSEGVGSPSPTQSFIVGFLSTGSSKGSSESNGKGFGQGKLTKSAGSWDCEEVGRNSLYLHIYIIIYLIYVTMCVCAMQLQV